MHVNRSSFTKLEEESFLRSEAAVTNPSAHASGHVYTR